MHWDGKIILGDDYLRTLIKNAKIFAEKGHFVEALLIEDGFVKKAGSNAELAGESVDTVLDMEGRTILPGLNDSHLHITMKGAAMNSCDLIPAKSIDDIIRLGREFLAKNPDMKAMPGRGWNQDYFATGEKRMINRFDLDQISTEIPIVFERTCGHVGVGNTKALEILGVDENTKVDGGEIEIGEDGKPNGIFNENAVQLIRKAIPEKDMATREKEFLMSMDYSVSQGLTSVQSCDVLGKDFKEVFKLLHDLYSEGKLKFRYRHQYNFQDIEDFKEYLKSEHITGKYDEMFFSKGALKLFKDGSLGARTAYMKKEYADAPGTFGVEALSDDQLQALVDLAVENDITVVTHAIGDAAVESVMNAYENTMIEGKNPLRHGIVHNQITSMEQLERQTRLQIPVMYQPIFLDYDNRVIEDRVGKELAKTSYAFNTLYKMGAPVSLGTDSPVEDCNPFQNIYCAVNRKGLDGHPEGGYYPEEAMTLEDAIDAYTVGSAFNEFKEDVKGKLLPGFVADLIVLDRDIFSIDPMEIKNVKVVKTMVNGKFVYER